MSEMPPSTAVGQVSPDGQFRWDGVQWVPVPRGVREPTPWTQPMQLAVAAFLALEAIFSVLNTFIFINRDTLTKVMREQGSLNNLPSGTDVDTVVSFALVVAYATVIVFAIIYLVAALGSYLGWRWMFWVVLVLFGLATIGALTNLGNLANPGRTEVPFWAIVVNELFGIASAALFVWLLVGLVRYGPWAMKKPGM